MKKTITLVLLALSMNSFSQSINLQLDTTQNLQNSDVGSVAYADIDQDGDNDVLITGNGPEGVSSTLYENDGNGNFTAMSQPAIVNVFTGAAEFADVDNDGDMDLLITGNTSSPTATANLYLNDGLGNFTISSGIPFEASNSGDIDFGDIDGDNDLDLIMTGINASDSVFTELYLNDGTGSFTFVNGTPFVPVFLSSTEFIDVDNDGDLDLLICGLDSSDEPSTNLYENNGSGIFSIVAGAPFANLNGDIAFGDTDNDGDQDILIAGSNTSGQNIAQFYLNNGSSFSLVPNTPFTGVSLHSSSFADFNNDGQLDLLHIGNTTTGLIGHIYENTGSNNFVLVDSSTISGSYNGSNIISDLNGDGKSDIITTGTSFTSPFRAPKIYFNQSVILSVNDFNNDDLDLKTFPNPSNGLFTIATNSTSQTDIEIFDMTGRLVLRDTFFGKAWDVHLKEAAGIYLVRIKTDNIISTKKIVLK